jgi:hypothetical protein
MIEPELERICGQVAQLRGPERRIAAIPGGMTNRN